MRKIIHRVFSRTFIEVNACASAFAYMFPAVCGIVPNRVRKGKIPNVELSPSFWERDIMPAFYWKMRAWCPRSQKEGNTDRAVEWDAMDTGVVYINSELTFSPSVRRVYSRPAFNVCPTIEADVNTGTSFASNIPALNGVQNSIQVTGTALSVCQSAGRQAALQPPCIASVSARAWHVCN